MAILICKDCGVCHSDEFDCPVCAVTKHGGPKKRVGLFKRSGDGEVEKAASDEDRADEVSFGSRDIPF